MSTDKNDKKTERSRQEAAIVESFLKVSQKKVEEIRVHRGDLSLSPGELQVLNNIHSAGMMEGLIAGVASFIILRRTPRQIERFMAARRARAAARSSGGYTLDPPSHGMTASPFHRQPLTTSPPPSQQRGLIWGSFQLLLDLSISVLVAAYTSSYMADVPKIVQQVTDIPLMEGRSGISDVFCEALVQEYKRQWNMHGNVNHDNSIAWQQQQQQLGKRSEPLHPFDHRPILKDPQWILLKGYVDFARNCQLRQTMERQIRQERGMKPDEPVEIPAPGVPRTALWKDDDFHGDDYADTDFYSSNSNNDAWTEEDAASFVSDREEDRRRK